ncbi:MAG: alpha/beta hydrolase [Actinomycetota bacterium]|nr:alpha/beta hydrolase [Actinomycetota bacterium]
MSAEELTFSSADGLTLEALLDAPEDPRAGLVLCHPHPKMGGTMNAPLLHAVADRVKDEGWSVLRFNFRGIGNSEGEPATGIDEVQDATGGIAVMRERYADLSLAIAGWSFGAAVAIRTAAEDDSLAACVAIAPAVREKPGVTAGLPHPEKIDLGVPLLIIAAANDELVEAEDCKTWVADIPHAEVTVVQGANHFFWGKYDKLGDEIVPWLNGFIPT